LESEVEPLELQVPRVLSVLKEAYAENQTCLPPQSWGFVQALPATELIFKLANFQC
jgi:hypothetical protein